MVSSESYFLGLEVAFFFLGLHILSGFPGKHNQQEKSLPLSLSLSIYYVCMHPYVAFVHMYDVCMHVSIYGEREKKEGGREREKKWKSMKELFYRISSHSVVTLKIQNVKGRWEDWRSREKF